MQRGTILDRDHSIDNILFENLVRITADLLKTFSCLIDFLLRFLIIIARLVFVSFFVLNINTSIKNLACIVWERGKGTGRFLYLRLCLILVHHIQLNKAAHHGLLSSTFCCRISVALGGSLSRLVLCLLLLNFDQDLKAVQHIFGVLNDFINTPYGSKFPLFLLIKLHNDLRFFSSHQSISDRVC